MARARWVAGAALVASAVFGSGAPASADEVKPSAMVLVLDASGSMNEPDGHGSTKIAAAKSALTTIVGQLPADLQVGLRVYGHRVASKPNHAKACQDTELVAPVAALDKAGLTAAIGRFKAKGETPIGLSLQQAAGDLPKGAAGSVVLVSDGQDSCAPPAPCDVARQLKASGVQVTVDTVGLKVDAKAKNELTCIATSTGGSYTDVTDTSQLATKLGTVTQQATRARRVAVDKAADGTKVEGTPSRDGAPKLVSGTTYLDTILEKETLFYAVDLSEGKEVTATVTIDGRKLPETTPNYNGAKLNWVDVDDDFISRDYENSLTGQLKSLKVKTPQIEPAGSERYPAGTYYVKLELEKGFGTAELPVTIVVSGGGQPQASASATEAAPSEDSPSPAASSSPGASPAPAAAAAPSGGGFTFGQVAAFTGGGFFAGLLTGLILMLQFRRRRRDVETRPVVGLPPAAPYGGTPPPAGPYGVAPPPAGPYNPGPQPPTYPGR